MSKQHKKGEILGYNNTKNKLFSTSKESLFRPTSRSSSKVVNTNTPYDDASNDESSDEDDQLAFISRKIRNIWKKIQGIC